MGFHGIFIICMVPMQSGKRSLRRWWVRGGDHLWGTLLFGKTGSLPIGEMSFPGRGGFQRVPQNRVEWAFGEGIRLAQT